MDLNKSDPNFDKIQVWQETYQYYQNAPDPNPVSIKYQALNIEPNPIGLRSQVRVLNNDIIDVALEYSKLGYKPLLLNMADISVPGGCVKIGSGAQEECCFRRSNYYKHLKPEFYPILGTSAIYSQKVEFIRANESVGSIPMKLPGCLDLIAIPALRFPQLDRNSGGYGSREEMKIMEEKIDMIFKVGFKHGHDVLVLSAFGCGAYGNPPQVVVELFQKALVKWQGCFKEICFAILGANFNLFKVLEIK